MWGEDFFEFFSTKWHSPDGSMTFHKEPKKGSISRAEPLPLALIMDLSASKELRMGAI